MKNLFAVFSLTVAFFLSTANSKAVPQSQAENAHLSGTLTDPSGTPAWRTIPSWAVVGTADHVIPPAEQLFMATRAHAHITEVDAPHLSMVANPGTVTQVILAAAHA